MSMTMDDSIKRWTAKRKTVLVIEIIQGKTTVSEASTPGPSGGLRRGHANAAGPKKLQALLDVHDGN